MRCLYTGTHEPGWLDKVDFPLCVARQRLWRNGRNVPRATVPWMLDSGAFKMIETNGRWTITPREYVALVRRCRDEIGMLDWAAPMDVMCEDHIRAKTGRWTADHIRWTIYNYFELRWLDPTLPIYPVLQGWHPREYLACADLYERWGVQLGKLPVVGLGGVCGLQDTSKAGQILELLEGRGYRIHGFGFKVKGLTLYAGQFNSADSMAWSYDGRRKPPLPGCSHKRCNNCVRYATRWQRRIKSQLGGAEWEPIARQAGQPWSSTSLPSTWPTGSSSMLVSSTSGLST